MFNAACRGRDVAPIANARNTDPGLLSVCEQMYPFFNSVLDFHTAGVRRRDGTPIRICMAFCADESLNAFALKSADSTYVIGIHTGAVERLLLGFRYLFKNNIAFTRPLPGLRLAASCKQRGPEEVLPYFCWVSAIQTLFFHELGHILYGHLDYMAAHGGSDAHIRYERGHDSLSPDLSQGMELCADAHATGCGIGSLIKGSICGTRTDRFVETAWDAFRATNLATLLLLHLFYDGTEDIVSAEFEDHPIGELRFYEFAVVASGILGSRDPRSSAERAFPVGLALDDLACEALRVRFFPVTDGVPSEYVNDVYQRLRKAKLAVISELGPWALIPYGTRLEPA